MKLKVHNRVAEKVIMRLHQAYKDRYGLLEVVDDLVENQIPPGVKPLSSDHAQFLFYIVVHDHGMKSTRLYNRAKKLFKINRDLFNSRKVLSKYSGPDDQALIEDTGRYLGTRYPRETAKIWYENSMRLNDCYQSDTINLFRSSNSAKGLLKEITTFRGYGPKTGGILLRAIDGLGFTEVDGFDEVLVPVDIHDSRISFFTGIVSLEDPTSNVETDYYSYAKEIQKILLRGCNSLDISWQDVDRALWLIGSRGCVNLDCVRCPIQDLCSVGKKMGPQKRDNSSGQSLDSQTSLF